jgi:hypothetical protein
MKAKMQLSVTVPVDWVAISNGIERKFYDAEKEGIHALERFGL